MSVRRGRWNSPRWFRPVAVGGLFVAGVAVLLLWLAGVFTPKVEPKTVAGASRPIGDGAVVEVTSRTLPIEETAVGTVQPVHRVEVASRLLARVMEVNATAGQRVARDGVLVRLDDTDLRARAAQAESAVAEARARLDQARTEEARIRSAHERGGATALELERSVNALKGVEAGLARAEQARAESQSVLAFATILSPIDGVVVEKRVNTGDTVTPGQIVVTILDPERMQLVASVRESLSRRLRVGASVSVRVEALEHACAGTVSEIVPEAEAASRTFQVKVTGPCPPGVYAGMFGRLSIPAGEETVLLVPRAGVRTVGQVDFVDVAVDGARQRRAVRLGRSMGDEIEVLAGLRAGERIVVDARAASGGDG